MNGGRLQTGSESLDVAVVGGGAAGIAASHYLSQHHRVDLYEAAPKLGGHVHTAAVREGSGREVPVDMGFIVFNDWTYPSFIRLLDELGVESAPTRMSFSYTDTQRDISYCSTGLNGLFATRTMLLRPWYWRFLLSIPRFYRDVNRDLERGEFGADTLGEYLRAGGYPSELGQCFALPMVRAIWSAEANSARDFPMPRFARFFANHGLLSLTKQPQWRFIPGGSRMYVQRFAERFPGRVFTDSPVRSINRKADGVELGLDDGQARYDAVVLACHADTALALLQDPDEHETRCLSPWRYSSNRVALHTDQRLLPANRRAWACWNVLEDAGHSTDQPVNVHYWMNLLQRLNTPTTCVVSLNAHQSNQAPRAESVVEDIQLEHPQYNRESLATQPELEHLNGQRATYFCGSYHGNGFHEDAIASGVRAAQALGALEVRP